MNPKANFGNKFRSKLRGIKPSASRDNSTSASNFTSFVFSESHYNLPIPLRFAFGIGVSTIKKLQNSNLTCGTGSGGRSDSLGVFE
jgi:hypothetical protein